MSSRFKHVPAASAAVALFLAAATVSAVDISKSGRFACTDDPTVPGVGLNAPTSFVAWCVPRGGECAVVPSVVHETAVFPTGTDCTTVVSFPVGGARSIMRDLAFGDNVPNGGGLDSVCDGVAAPSADVRCGFTGNAVTCIDIYPESGPDFAPFDICVQGVDVVDSQLAPGDGDTVALNGLVFSGLGKSKARLVPMLGSWGAGALAMSVLAGSALLLRRRRVRGNG